MARDARVSSEKRRRMPIYAAQLGNCSVDSALGLQRVQLDAGNG
uniref:Uncharacterized protein n=1 Tax=Peronospora matthiolae TaxID=2874970 RepID=A0AAV1TQM3_9STRA